RPVRLGDHRKLHRRLLRHPRRGPARQLRRPPGPRPARRDGAEAARAAGTVRVDALLRRLPALAAARHRRRHRALPSDQRRRRPRRPARRRAGVGRGAAARPLRDPARRAPADDRTGEPIRRAGRRVRRDATPRADVTVLEIRPRYEGANIGTWIGFKHLNYLVEEAVLEHLRRTGTSPPDLYHDHGLCVDLVDIDTRILRALRVDDLAIAEVTPAEPGALRFKVAIRPDADS